MLFSVQELLLFTLAALVLVLTPGPNMVYCVSRSLTQGPRAGLVSLTGVVLGFVVHLPHDSPRTLFLMGFMTNLLNPKVAMFYLSFFPQFLHPERGQLLQQSLTLGAVQISTSAAVNALLVLGAARVALFLNRNAAWMRAQRYFMGTVLGLLALKLLTEKKAAA